MKIRIVLLLAVIYLLVLTSQAYAFRLFVPRALTVPAGQTRAIISRSTWSASDGPGTTTNYTLAAGDQLNLVVNGVNRTVTFGAGTFTAAQIQATITAQLNAQSGGPGWGNAIVVDAANGSGAVRIEATGSIALQGDGGTANTGDNNDLWFEAPIAGPYPIREAEPSDPAPFLHWDHRRFPTFPDYFEVPYTLNSASAVSTDGANLGSINTTLTANFANAIDAAFDSYTDVSPAAIDFKNVADTRPAPTYFVQDNWNTLNWTTSAAVPDLANYSGLTALWIDTNTGRILESDIIFNNNPGYMWTDTGQNNFYREDIQGVATHEIGHFIGLAHAPGANTDTGDVPTMSYGNGIWGSTAAFQADPNKVTLQLRSLAVDDQNAVNFLYTPDLGDAPDDGNNNYPSYAVGNVNDASSLNGIPLRIPRAGADHFYGYQPAGYAYEWLGAKVEEAADSEESESKQVNQDEHDDGVTFGSFRPGTVSWVKVTVNINNVGNHTGNRYLNSWVDFNGDKDWDDAGEKIIDGVVFTASGTQTFPVNVPAETTTTLWARFRLDYGENVGVVAKTDVNPDLNQMRYAAQFGEVEDHLIPPPTGEEKTIIYLVALTMIIIGATLVLNQATVKPKKSNTS